MEALAVLEKKVGALLAKVGDLRHNIDQLRDENKVLHAENEEQRRENARLIEDNAQLMAKLDALESVMLEENGQIQELSDEKAATVQLVDDLIKSIDSFVNCETQ